MRRLLFAVLLIAGCGGGDALEGRWSQAEAQLTASDGQFSLLLRRGGSLETRRGRYRLTEGSLTMAVTASDCIDSVGTQIAGPVEIKMDVFGWETRPGSLWVWYRADPEETPLTSPIFDALPGCVPL